MIHIYVNTLSDEPSDLTHDEKLIASDVEDIKLLGLRYIHEFIEAYYSDQKLHLK